MIKVHAMQTLNSAITWFLAHCADHRKLSPHTLKAYRQDLDHLLAFAPQTPGDVDLAIVDKNFVRRWLGSMSDVRPRTMRRRLATLKSWSRWDKRRQILPGGTCSHGRVDLG